MIMPVRSGVLNKPIEIKLKIQVIIIKIIQYNMKHNIRIIISLIFIITLFINCRYNNDKEFPSQIHTTKTERHIRIKGTNVFALIPTDYNYIENLVRFQKNNNQYIQFTVSKSLNFTKNKSKFTAKELEKKYGRKIDFLCDVKLNEFDAIYFEGPSTFPNKTELAFIFGDTTFFVMISGFCQTADKEGKKEIQEIIKSIFYDKSIQFNPLEMAKFEFDSTITNFKLAQSFTNLFIFNKDGIYDSKNTTSNEIIIQVLPHMSNYEALNFAIKTTNNNEKNKIKLSNTNIEETKINNYIAYKLATKTIKNSVEGILYQVLLIGDNTSILFIGNAYNDLDTFLYKFKKTVESLKIK